MNTDNNYLPLTSTEIKNLRKILNLSQSELANSKATIDKVLLAIPSITRNERRILVNKLQSNGFEVLQIPSIEEITNGNARIDSLRPIAIEDLLGRDKVPPDQKLLRKQLE